MYDACCGRIKWTTNKKPEAGPFCSFSTGVYTPRPQTSTHGVYVFCGAPSITCRAAIPYLFGNNVVGNNLNLLIMMWSRDAGGESASESNVTCLFLSHLLLCSPPIPAPALWVISFQSLASSAVVQRTAGVRYKNEFPSLSASTFSPRRICVAWRQFHGVWPPFLTRARSLMKHVLTQPATLVPRGDLCTLLHKIIVPPLSLSHFHYPFIPQNCTSKYSSCNILKLRKLIYQQ